jgi:hypothetical protein
MSIFAILLLVIIPVVPLSACAKDYQSIVRLAAWLQNECSSEDAATNCANNNAETYGDENNVNPQVTRSSQVEIGSTGEPGPLRNIQYAFRLCMPEIIPLRSTNYP